MGRARSTRPGHHAAAAPRAVRALRQVRLEGRLNEAIGLWFSNGFDSETLPGRMRAIYAQLSAELYATTLANTRARVASTLCSSA